MANYYPFGLTFNSYSRENSVENKFKFQGQEHIDDLDLGWDSFKWRNHQPDIGRFFNIDPLSEKYYYNSPYAFCENQVTTFYELEGMERGGRGGTPEYMEMRNARNSIRKQEVMTSYRYQQNSRLQDMNGPREKVFVGSYQEPQTRNGEIVTSVLNLLDANGIGEKLVRLQVSLMKTETITTNGLGESSSDGSKFVFTGPDAGKLEGREMGYQSKVNATFDERFSAFASEKLGTDFNSLSPEEQAKFRTENTQTAGAIRMGVQNEMGLLLSNR